MGDFNEVVNEQEKFGGNPVNQNRIRPYVDCMNCCGMLDLGFSGPRYTWSNKRGLTDLIQLRLDRCWPNSSWKSLFKEANVTHLAQVNSDHCPLLLNLSPPLPSCSERPFRFQPMWMSHWDFPRVVNDAWEDKDFNLPGAVDDFTVKN